MRVSAIVPAPELNDFGRRCIDALLALPEAVEVVFVPDERVPGLDSRVVQVPSGDATTAAKRQLGLEAAGGEVIALIDDDAFPDQGWLPAALAELERDPAVAAVCGPTLTPADDSELERLSGRVYASPLVSGPAVWRYAKRPPRDVDDAPSVNLVLRREDAVAAGFDTEFRWGEDTVLCERLLERGRRIRYVPEAVVWHSRRPLWMPHLRQLYRWARHRGAFARAGGANSLRPAYFAPSALIAGILLGPFVSRPLWRAGLLAYGLACLLAGHDRNPARWLRLAGAIAATHAAYGAGFAQGFAGRTPPGR